MNSVTHNVLHVVIISVSENISFKEGDTQRHTSESKVNFLFFLKDFNNKLQRLNFVDINKALTILGEYFTAFANLWYAL